MNCRNVNDLPQGRDSAGPRETWSLVCTPLCTAIIICTVLFADLRNSAADDRVDYLNQIKPLLRERCFGCHGALKQEGGLRLDTAALAIAGGDSGEAIAIGDAAAESLLLQRVSATDPSDRMPPEHEGEPLTVEQTGLLHRWILAGAPAPDDEKPETDPAEHWAFQPIVRPQVPELDSTWVKNPIDAFLENGHRDHDLTPQPEATRIVLLRRLYLDLLGVPPSADEIAAFENDEPSHGYEETVQRLLDDPRHGERWARHWMDIWRYSDWWGLGQQLRNSQKHIWHWRDWLVESINDDVPYDEMLRLMLAADELHPNDLSKLRATGYLARNYFLFNRPQWMQETVEHVSKGILGLTLNCARCHDHKFDPLAQEDYYRMRAFFEPYHVRLDVVPGQPDLTKDGIPRVFDGMPDTPTWLYIRGDERTPDKSEAISPGVPAVLAFEELKVAPVSLPHEAWQPERRPWVFAAYLTAAATQLKSAESDLSRARTKLAEATHDGSQSDSNRSSPIAPASAADSQLDLRVAETAVAVAQADYRSIRQRADAQAAAWNATKKMHEEEKEAAIRAERNARESQAQHAVVVAERALAQAAADKKEPATQSLRTAEEALNKAAADSAADIKPTEQFTPLVGALWTPTRFYESRTDDPQVEFLSKSTGRRTALAKWITDRRNPLTARVAANHIWTRHMGQPLVPTLFDFGRKGIPPTHPELLDWLAVELMDNGWSMKHLHRLIVNSAAYRMSSTMSNGKHQAAKDPENHWLWRRVPIRLESQVIRDSLLKLAGTLDPTMGGPPVSQSQQADSTRRSLYFFHSNNERNLFLTMFDEALVKDCYRREQSIVPQQALALTNSQLVLDASERIATQLSVNHADNATFIRTAFRVIVGINPSDVEMQFSAEAIEDWLEPGDGSVQAARSNFIWALINHNDFVTLR